jgi:bla regulator protein BlaR1
MSNWLDTAWLVEALIGTSLLMLLVLIVRRPVAWLWGAHFAYALWALPALRMVLPAIPGWQSFYMPVAAAKPDGGTAVALMPAADAAAYTQPLPIAAEPGLVADWPALLLALWVAGALAFLAVQWGRHVRFIGRAVRDGECLARTGGVDVIVSAHVPGPMAAGIFRRRVLLPADFTGRYSPAERRLALLHEGAHHDRLDLVANLAGLMVLAAHWWNPIAHAAWRAFRSDQELACDATVLAGSDGDTRAAYAGALLKSACVATPIAACAMNHKRQLKERIAMMKDRQLGRFGRAFGLFAVTGLAAGGLIATASGAQPAQPAPPAPPAPPAAAAPAAPPAPPAAPEAPRVMILTRMTDAKGEKGEKAKKGEKTVVRTMIMKDGKMISEHGAAGDGVAHVMMFGGDGQPPLPPLPPTPGSAPGNADVHVTTTADGRKLVMLRRLEGTGEAGKAAEAHIAAIRADMRARCDKEGIKMPADADLPQLATCGMEMQKKVREAMASARAAIETTAGLSAEQRAQALKGIDAAMANTRQEFVLKMEK